MNTLFTDEQEASQSDARPVWKRVLQRVALQGPDYSDRKLAVRRTYLLLLAMSLVFGLMCGLMLSTRSMCRRWMNWQIQAKYDYRAFGRTWQDHRIVRA